MNQHPRFLLVDLPAADTISEALCAAFPTATVDTVDRADAASSSGGADVVVLGMEGASEGSELLRQLRRRHPGAAILVIDASPTVQCAVDSMRDGADDYLAADDLDRTLVPAIEAIDTGSGHRAIARETASRYRSLMEQAADGIFITTLEGVLLDVNTSLASMLGYKRDDLIGRSMQDLFDVEEPNNEREGVRRLTAGDTLVGARRIRRRDGRWATIEGTARLLPDGTVQGIVRDVTDRMRIDEEQQRISRTFQAVFQACPLAITVYDLEGVVRLWNPAAERIFGYSAAEAVGHPIPTIPEDRREEIPMHIQAVLQGELLSGIETKRRAKNGEILDIALWDAPLVDVDGQIRGIVSIKGDITERKRVEAERTRLLELEKVARERAEEAQSRLSFIAEVSEVLGSSLNYETTLRSVARMAVPRLADWCAIDMLNESGMIERLDVYHRDPKKIEWAHDLYKRYPIDMNAPTGLPKVLRSGVAEFYPVITDEMLVEGIKDPEMLAVAREVGYSALMIVPLRAHNRTLGAITLVSTESKRHYERIDLELAEELARRAAIAVDNSRLYSQTQLALGRAEDASQAKDTFLAILSHELRTPLTPVLTAVQALKETGHAGDAQVLEIIRRNIELEARLIDDLLDLTRISRGKLQLALESVDVFTLLRNVIGVCQQEIATKRINLAVDLHADRHFVEGDSARVQQIFWNLLKNAIKFTPEDGTIAVRAFNRGERILHVEVADTGIGIAPERIDSIFDPFDQGDPSITRRYGGLGLGLAISKSLADMHGWSLSVVSPGEGKGATFSLEMRTVAHERRTGAAGSGKGEGEVSARHVTILLVDDHPDTNLVIRLLLERHGYEVMTANSVASALELARQRSFDLLISDIGLPDGTGTELMISLRKQRDVRGIALSGYGMEEDIRRSLDAGFDTHLTKPVTYDSLQEAIDRVLEGDGGKER